MQIKGEKDKKGNYIPDSISFSFTDNKINTALANYLSYKNTLKNYLQCMAKTKKEHQTVDVQLDDMMLTLEQTKNKILISDEKIEKE